MKEGVELQFGKGLISGYIYTLLEILSLMGALCFHFPDLFTVEDMRASYSIPFVRWTLFTTLVLVY